MVAATRVLWTRPAPACRALAFTAAISCACSFAAFAAGAQVAPESPARPVFPVRSVYTAEFGLAEPAGITHLAGSDTLLLAGNDGGATLLARIKGEELVGLSSVPAADPETVASDPSEDQVALISGSDVLTLPRARLSQSRPQPARRPLGPANVRDPAGAAFEPSGDLLVLDAEARNVARIKDADANLGVSRISLAALGGVAIRGLSVNPADGLVYVGSPSERRLYGLDGTGAVKSLYDLGSAELSDQRGFVFAPSADPTDNSATTSLFVEDAGETATDGRVVELALAAPAALALPPETSQLVQTIGAFQWSPPAPDTAGIAYLAATDHFVVSDSEVEEMPIYANVNLWRTTRTGTVVHTGTTAPAVSNEPTGLAYRASDATLLVSDDNANRITMLRPGGDGRYGTSDDPITFFSTLPHSDDSEDVAYDSVSGAIFIVDGVGTQVYRVSSGANSIFGDGDDVWSNFDLEQYGARDPEGITHDPASNTLYVVDQGSRAIFELTPAGALLRTIDLRPSASLSAADVEVAPGSIHPERTNFWVVDRGVDNGPDPDENDGKIYELSVGTGGNTAPVVDSAVIPQTTPRTNDVLTVTATAHDDDDDPITLRYQWRKNGTAIAGQTAATLNLAVAGHGDKGDAISVRVAAFDGIVEGAPRTSGQRTIVNSPPAFSQDVGNQTSVEGQGVLLGAGAIDPDGDALTYAASGLPSGLSINTGTGAISGTIAAGAAGASPYSVSVSVREGAVPDAVDTFSWTVGTKPTVVAGSVTTSEGNAGSHTVAVPVTLSAPAVATVSVGFQTLDSSAQAPSDYVATSGTVTFAPGQTSKTIPVQINGDNVHEPNELLLVSLRNPNGVKLGGYLGLGVVFVNNDDPLPVIQPGAVTSPEGDTGTTTVNVPVTLNRPSSSTVRVEYLTLNNSAVAPSDFQATNGSITFAPGQTSAVIPVRIVGDLVNEPAESFLVSLRNPTNAKIGGFYGLGVVTIANDD